MSLTQNFEKCHASFNTVLHPRPQYYQHQTKQRGGNINTVVAILLLHILNKNGQFHAPRTLVG